MTNPTTYDVKNDGISAWKHLLRDQARPERRQPATPPTSKQLKRQLLELVSTAGNTITPLQIFNLTGISAADAKAGLRELAADKRILCINGPRSIIVDKPLFRSWNEDLQYEKAHGGK